MKNTNNTLAAIQLNQVIEQLDEQTGTDSLVIIYNDYASNNGYERIYDLDENTINELYNSPWQALYDSNHKDFNDRDYFFTYNGNGHMVSFSNEDDSNSPIDISELAQWLISEDKLSDYDIEVVTLDDMLASIEDNITDDSELLKKLTDYVDKSVFAQDALMINKYNECNDFIIYEYMRMLGEYSYKELNDVINHLGINYQ